MRILNIMFLVFAFMSCNYKPAGTLGGGYVYEFNCSEEELNKCLDDFKQNSNSLDIPEKWKQYDDWDDRGYTFLKGKIFYFGNNYPLDEEMYFVTVLKSDGGNSDIGRASIRSVFRKADGLSGWRDFKDLNKSDAKRIEERFQKNVLDRLIRNCKCNSYKIITDWPPK